MKRVSKTGYVEPKKREPTGSGHIVEPRYIKLRKLERILSRDAYEHRLQIPRTWVNDVDINVGIYSTSAWGRSTMSNFDHFQALESRGTSSHPLGARHLGGPSKSNEVAQVPSSTEYKARVLGVCSSDRDEPEKAVRSPRYLEYENISTIWRVLHS